MNLPTRIFVTLTAWTTLFLWVTKQPESQTLLMWPMIDTVMIGTLLALGLTATIMLLSPRPSPQVIA